MTCERCGKPKAVCVCDRITPMDNATDVLILQHPQEEDVVLGTVPLLLLSLKKSKRAIGLSWRSLSDALGREADPKEWAVMYPLSMPKEVKAPALTDKKGNPIPSVRGIILLDGTWSQAKALWWRNAWLLKCARILVAPKEPSLYGKLRKEPRREFVSTLEATGAALTMLGENPEIETTLKRTFRTMLQRARDAAGHD